MPEPIRTPKSTGVYGAPRGLEEEVGGLPFYREETRSGSAVVSVWEFSTAEREAIAEGANIVLGIHGMEPIPPVSLTVARGEQYERFPAVAGDADVAPVSAD